MSSKTHDLQTSCKLRCNGIGLCQSSQCIIKSPFRTVSSCSTNNGQGKVTDESVDCKSRERGEIQWHKLSDDEKNIYFAHKTACMKGENSYADPVTGYMVFTEEFLMKRRSCCGNGCRHCPYGHENVPQSQRNKKFNSAFYV
ncbi:hypothetical protein ACROYT_G003336 [Oculina patagonica]